MSQTQESVPERYQRLCHAFAATITDGPAERWSDPSPCAGWTARDVVAHVVDTQDMFEKLVGRSLTPGPSVLEDPLGAFRTATDQVQAHLAGPATAEVEYEGSTGRRSFAAAVDSFLAFDLVVHRWDLARATGLAEHIDPVDLQRVSAACTEWGQLMHGSGQFAEPVDIDPNATDQDRVLALLGRTP